MAVILTMNYMKKLGLPNFSSHSCSVSIQSEISDLGQVTGEIKRLYALAQDGADRELQQVGWMPADPAYGLQPASNGADGRRETQDRGERSSGEPRNANGGWNCSEKQRALIEKIVREKNLEKRGVEDLAIEMFGNRVRQLNRLEASGLIDELLDRYGGGRRGNSNGYRGRYQREPREASR